ncbi:hypothetical protein [Planctomycetes bacterium TBK1r]|uniref:hypothetical protein n=1 Tax=Stieleria magnilauensis TaxID=2527963 RepID=UPI0011A60DEA
MKVKVNGHLLHLDDDGQLIAVNGVHRSGLSQKDVLRFQELADKAQTARAESIDFKPAPANNPKSTESALDQQKQIIMDPRAANPGGVIGFHLFTAILFIFLTIVFPAVSKQTLWNPSPTEEIVVDLKCHLSILAGWIILACRRPNPWKWS